MRARGRAALELSRPPFAETADALGLAAATLAYEGEPTSPSSRAARRGLERGVTGAGPHLHDVRIEAGAATSARSARRASSGSRSSRSSSPRPRRSRERTTSRRSSSSTTSSPELDGNDGGRSRDDHRGGSQTVVTATAAAALPSSRRSARRDAGEGAADGAHRQRGRARARAQRKSRRDLALAALTTAWPAVVGDAIARQAWPLRHRSGRDAARRDDVGDLGHRARPFLAGEIVERLRAELGPDAPARLRFRRGPGPGAGDRGTPSLDGSARSTEVPEEIASEAASAASAIDDPGAPRARRAEPLERACSGPGPAAVSDRLTPPRNMAICRAFLMAEAAYTAKDITVLEGLEPVRLRPGMYIGSTGSRGLHHLVYEVVDNAVDEALAGRNDLVDVTIHPDNSVTVRDAGAGIPVDVIPEQGLPALTVVLTKLHAGGKFGGEGYKVSGRPARRRRLGRERALRVARRRGAPGREGVPAGVRARRADGDMKDDRRGRRRASPGRRSRSSPTRRSSRRRSSPPRRSRSACARPRSSRAASASSSATSAPAARPRSSTTRAGSATSSRT